MKKSIFWDFNEKPLNIAHLVEAQTAISAADKDTFLSIVNVDANDLQLLVNALNIYHGMGKELREMMTSIAKLHTGQKLVFDKQDETKKHNDHVNAELQKVVTLMRSIPDSNKAMTKEVIELHGKMSVLIQEMEDKKDKVVV